MACSLLWPVGCGLWPVHAQQVLDRVIARVNGQPITLTDARAAIGLGVVQAPSGGDAIAPAARELIDRLLMLQEVARFSPPEPAPQALAAEVEALEKHAGTPAALDALMTSTGLNRTRVRELARDTLRIRAYVAQRFGASGSDPATIQRWVSDLRRRATIVCQLPSGGTC
jgi:hypothetical protein